MNDSESKSSAKTSDRKHQLVRQPHGGALLPGAGGGRQPGQGRPPDAWKALCRELASSDEVLTAAREILADRDHPAWLGAWKWVTERGYGKTPDTVELSGPGGGPMPHMVLVRFVRPDEQEEP